MKVTFLGVNASGYTNCWGYHFPCGEAVEVDDPAAIEEAERHPEFEVGKAAVKAAKEFDHSDPNDVPSASEEALVEAAKKFDHDGDGKPGGSKPKAKAKK